MASVAPVLSNRPLSEDVNICHLGITDWCSSVRK